MNHAKRGMPPKQWRNRKGLVRGRSKSAAKELALLDEGHGKKEMYSSSPEQLKAIVWNPTLGKEHFSKCKIFWAMHLVEERSDRATSIL